MSRVGHAVASALLALALLRCAEGGDVDDSEDLQVPERRYDAGLASEPDAVTLIPADAEASGDGSTADGNAPAACDVTKPFGTPQKLAGFPAGQYAMFPSLSRDELTLYYTSFVSSVGNLARATRASKSDNFGSVQALTGVNSGSYDGHPSVTADHLTLYFYSTRSGAGDLYVSARASTAAAFGSAVAVSAPVNGGSSLDFAPYYVGTPTAGQLWFGSDRGGNFSLWVSTKTGATFSAPVAAPGVPTGALEGWPQVSDDGLRIVYMSNDAAGLGSYDIWMAKRASTTAPFGTPTALTELNTSGQEYGAWMSEDGCRVYLAAIRAGDTVPQLYFAARP